MLKYVLQQYAIVTWLEHLVFIEIWGAPWNGRSVFKRRELLTPPFELTRATGHQAKYNM